MKEYRNQWHPGCSGAIELELRKDRAHLSFEREHLVNSKPIQMDMLIIKKAKGVVTENTIGKIFRGHNIIEFKSPNDELNYDTYIKGIGYACIYKANERHVDEISMDDITLTFLRSRRPGKLLKQLSEKEYTITEPYVGIYYIQKDTYLVTQIIVTEELDAGEHVWLRALTDRLREEDARRLAFATRDLSLKGDVDNADAVIQVSMKANKDIFERMREDKIVCEALREFFQPEIEQQIKEANESGIQQGMQQGIQQGIQQGSDAVLDIQQKLKAGESKESLIGQGYEKSIVDKAYTVLFD
jgi:hypothetical protein